MKFNIRTKVNILSISVILICGFTLSFYFVQHETAALTSELEEKATVLLNSIAISSEYPIVIRDKEAITRIVEGILRQKDILFCRIEDKTGKVISEAGIKNESNIKQFVSPVLTKNFQKSADDAMFMDIDKKAGKEENEEIGKIYLGMSLSGLNHKLKDVKRTIVFVVFLTIIVASIASSLLLKLVLSRPINTLIRGTERIAKGDLNYKVTIKTEDEIGTLAKSFNKMTENLQKITVSKGYIDNIIKSMIDTLIVVNLDGTIRLVNQATLDMTGYEENEMIGKPLDIVFENIFFKSIYNELLDKRIIGNAEKVYVTKYGIKIPVLFSSSLMNDSTGKVEAIVCVAQDITERKRAEEEIEKSLSLLRATLESTTDGIVVVNREGQILSYNQKFLDIWNIPNTVIETRDEQQVFKYVLTQLKEPSGFLDSINELYKKPDNESFDVIEFTDNRIFERYSLPQRIGGKSIGRVWSFRNVTEKKLAEKERQNLQDQLLQSEKMSAVGQLAGGVAHEINNPLGVILGFAQSVNRRIKPNDPLTIPLKSIEREAKRCKNLVQELLTFSRIGKTEKEECNINELIESSLPLVEAETKVKSVELFRELMNEPPLVLVNKNQIQQVIVNLCNNAIDAMPQGGKLTIRNGKITKNNNEYLELQIEDNGMGIPKDIQTRIFEPFFTTKEVGKGTGLGLSLVYEIMQKHQGIIELDSTEGKGSIFKVLFPI